MFCSFYLILYIIWFHFSLSLTPFYYFDYYEHQYFLSVLFHMFFWFKMHYLDHLLQCPIRPSLKVVQLRRLFDWTNVAAALPQFFGAACHHCSRGSVSYIVITSGMSMSNFGFEEKPENINLRLSSYDLYWYSYDKKYSYNDDMCYQKRKLSVF